MIVVGYSADPFGRAALEHGIAEAKLRNTTLQVINASSSVSRQLLVECAKPVVAVEPG
jgi:hypothetical protein